MKILNLYAGLGGNRHAFNGHEVTAVESSFEIAMIYHCRFPIDTVVIGDAHQFLLDHFQEYDFIWSSPPCQTHSRPRYSFRKGKNTPPKYPDMRLYEEIILLQKWFVGDWVVENTISYYQPLIKPQTLASHYFWSNKQLSKLPQINRGHNLGRDCDRAKQKGIDLGLLDGLGNKRQHLRNMVEPETAVAIFKQFERIK